MATPYSVVDNSFLSKLTDDYLLDMPEEDLQTLIDGYRNSASIRFKQCKKLDEKNDDLRQYNENLTIEEIEILANLMVLEWLKPLINSIEILKQNMSTKDYRMYSQANHLKELQALRSNTIAEIDSLIVSYTYTSDKLNDLGRA